MNNTSFSIMFYAKYNFVQHGPLWYSINVEIHIIIHFQLLLLFFVVVFLLVLYKSIFIVIYIHKHNFLSSSAVFGGLASIESKCP